jgi:hypothetical protein
MRWHAVSRISSQLIRSLGLVLLLCNSIRAEPPPNATSAQAVQASYEPLIEEALQAYEAGRFAEARSMFKRAHALNPTARTLRGIGMCSFNLGDYVDAVFQLEQAVAETRKPLTEEQQARARDLIVLANARVGRFRLRLTPPEAVLLVDGNPAILLDATDLIVEAGNHEIEARAPGYLMAHSTLRVEGGDRTTLVFHLNRDDYAVAASQNLSPRPGLPGLQEPIPGAAAPSSERSGAWVRPLGYVSLGLGAASLLGFAVSGALALADENKLQDRCPNELCSEMYRSTVRRYDTMRVLATVTLVTGGVLTVLGTTLLIAAPSGHASEHVRQAPIEPIIGLGGIGVRGSL